MTQNDRKTNAKAGAIISKKQTNTGAKSNLKQQKKPINVPRTNRNFKKKSVKTNTMPNQKVVLQFVHNLGLPQLLKQVPKATLLHHIKTQSTANPRVKKAKKFNGA